MDETKRRKDGTFLPGRKGSYGNLRKGTYYVKGHQGFLRRPIVILYPDGSHRIIPSVAQAAKYLGWANRQMVTRAATKGFVKDGVRLMYKEDWSPMGDYHFSATQSRDSQGRATPEMMRRLRRLQERNMTDEQRRKKKERARQIAMKNIADPSNSFGHPPAKPLYCLTNDTVYSSTKQASETLGIPAAQIYDAMRRGSRCHGYKFYYKEIWDRVIMTNKYGNAK